MHPSDGRARFTARRSRIFLRGFSSVSHNFAGARVPVLLWVPHPSPHLRRVVIFGWSTPQCSLLHLNLNPNPLKPTKGAAPKVAQASACGVPLEIACRSPHSSLSEPHRLKPALLFILQMLRLT